MRAIDADFVQDALTKTITELLSKSQNESTQYVAMGLASIKTIIDIAPTLDVAPVRHGRWVRCKGKSTLWHCSECGERIVYNPTRKTYNVRKKNVAEVNQFCRACGAKMDAGQEDDSHGENTDE